MSPEGERAASLLKLANYARVAEVLGVSRASVARWAKGDQVTPWQLERLQKLLGRNENDAPPEWARRLAIRVRANNYQLNVTDEDLARAEAEQIAEEAVGADGPGQRPPGSGGASGGASA